VKVYYLLHENPPHVPMQSQLNAVHIRTCYFVQAYFNITFSSTSTLLHWPHPIRVFEIKYAFLISHACFITPLPYILQGFITLIIFGKEHKL